MTYYEFLSLRFDFCRFIREVISKEHLAQKYPSPISIDSYYFTHLPPFRDFVTDRMKVLYEMLKNINIKILFKNKEIRNKLDERLKEL